LIIKRLHSTYTPLVGDILEIHCIFMFFIFEEIWKFWNSWNFFGLCIKKVNKLYKMTSNQCTKSISNKVTMAKFILWAK
jgi:hypothetical protein